MYVGRKKEGKYILWYMDFFWILDGALWGIDGIRMLWLNVMNVMKFV